MRVDNMTYDVFVEELLLSLQHLFLDKSAITCFAGDEGDGRDSATVYGDRAIYLYNLDRHYAELLGADEGHHVLGYTTVTHRPMITHSAYARNIRRWKNGDILPRKLARTDLVLVSVCWLYAWGDERALRDDAHEMAREELHERLLVDAFSDTNPVDVAVALAERSATAYENSRNARRTI